MKRVLLLILSIFLVACQSAPISYDFGDLEIYEYDLNGVPHYFSYPATAYLKEGDYLTFETCKVYFGSEKPDFYTFFTKNPVKICSKSMKIGRFLTLQVL